MTPFKTIIGTGFTPKKSIISGGYTAFKTVIAGVIGAAGFAGIINGTSICTGTIRAKGDFAGTSAGSSTVAGTIRISSSAMTGTSDGIATVSGIVTAKGILIAISAGIATANGSMQAMGALAGNSAGLSTASGSLGSVGTYTATSAGSSSAVGELTGKGALVGSGEGIAITAAVLIAKGTLAGSGAGLSTVSGLLAAKGTLAGSSAGAATVPVVTLVAKGILTGASAGSGTAASTIRAKGAAAGSSAGTSTVAGTIRIAGGAVTGQSDGLSVVTGTLTGWDTDALALFTFGQSLGGSYTATEKTSTSQLFKNWKAHGLFTKVPAVYGIGSSAVTQKINGKDPRDLDAAFRATIHGTITHSSTGFDPNGSTGYMNTKFSPLSHGSQNSMGFFYYSRQNNTGTATHSMGCYNNVVSSTNINHSTAANSGRVALNQEDGDALFVIGVTDTRGLWHAVRPSSTTLKLYINGVVNASDTNNNSNTPISPVVYIGARNANGTAQLFCNQECGIAGITTSMTDAEALDFYNDILTWLTANGRNV